MAIISCFTGNYGIISVDMNTGNDTAMDRWAHFSPFQYISHRQQKKRLDLATISIKIPNFAVCMGNKKSIYQRASEWGLPFGLYLSCAAVASIFADWFAPLSVIFLLLLVATPLVVYYFQRRKFDEDDGFTEYAALWMLGILLFILGAVIAGFIIFLVLQYVRPNFMYEQAQAVIEAYSQIPQMQDSEMLHVVKRMVDEKLMPTPIETVFSSFWFISFGGSLLSAITAIIAQRPLKKHRKRQE